MPLLSFNVLSMNKRLFNTYVEKTDLHSILPYNTYIFNPSEVKRL